MDIYRYTFEQNTKDHKEYTAITSTDIYEY